MKPLVAIIGAGPAGLTLACLLQQADIYYNVFDLRPAPSSASASVPSGSLDLHTESGQRALQEAGLHDEFLKLARPGGEDMIIVDKAGHIFYSTLAERVLNHAQRSTATN